MIQGPGLRIILLPVIKKTNKKLSIHLNCNDAGKWSLVRGRDHLPWRHQL
jgi:hypothetical protein